MMKMPLAGVAALTLLWIPTAALAGPGGGAIAGKVTYTGTVPKPKPLDLSKEPSCMKIHWTEPLFPENVVTGAGNSLRNVVVYISSGAPEPPAVPTTPVLFEQQDCHYATHVLAVRAGQEIKISNNDPFSHNIHPLAKVNREWNKIQPPNTPPFSYAYDKEEFIHVKCNIHPWMEGYFAVLKTNYFAVTGDDGRFLLPDLPPGHYTITAWQELYGTKNQEITITGGETQTVNFVFSLKP